VRTVWVCQVYLHNKSSPKYEILLSRKYQVNAYKVTEVEIYNQMSGMEKTSNKKETLGKCQAI